MARVTKMGVNEGQSLVGPRASGESHEGVGSGRAAPGPACVSKGPFFSDAVTHQLLPPLSSLCRSISPHPGGPTTRHHVDLVAAAPDEEHSPQLLRGRD